MEWCSRFFTILGWVGLKQQLSSQMDTWTLAILTLFQVTHHWTSSVGRGTTVLARSVSSEPISITKGIVLRSVSYVIRSIQYSEIVSHATPVTFFQGKSALFNRPVSKPSPLTAVRSMIRRNVCPASTATIWIHMDSANKCLLSAKHGRKTVIVSLATRDIT